MVDMFTLEPSVMTTNQLMLIYLLFLLVMIALYIYSGFALMKIAKKTNTKNPWLAWIPIGNIVLMANIAKMHWWPILLMIPAFISIIIAVIATLVKSYIVNVIFMSIYWILIGVIMIYSTIWNWKIFEAVNRPGWWALIGIAIMPIYLIFMYLKLPVLTISTSIVGTLISLTLLGIAAWGNVEIKSSKKRAKKNNIRT